VKQVSVVQASDEVASQFGLLKSLSVNARTLGPRVGGEVQRIIREAKAGNWTQRGDLVVVDGTELFEGEFEITMVANKADADQAVGITSTGFVLLNTVLTPELEAEGAARDAIRHIQQARKDAGLDVSDRISLTLRVDAGSLEALKTHAEFIASETLAVKFEVVAAEVSGELSIGDAGLIEIELSKK
jgi:isoleucyl-tRNA synthetase